jgi:hypothetical protein
MVRARKTEHSGSKNGGGHWGPREVPANHEDMSSYAEVLISHSRLEVEKEDSDKNWLQIAKNLGMVGSGSRKRR